MRITVSAGIVLGLAWLGLAQERTGPSGLVRDETGRAVAGALVTARDTASGRAFTVYTDREGRYTLPTLPDGTWPIEVRGPEAEGTPRVVTSGTSARTASAIELGPVDSMEEPPAAEFWVQLPDGAEKRRIIVDCGGCHTFNSTHARKDGRERTEEEWRTAIARMVAMAGQGTGFPIISGLADPEADARWFSRALAGAGWPTLEPTSTELLPPAGTVLTEFDLPVPGDLPHDLVVDGAGQVLITGMFTHQMYVLDPVQGLWQTVAIPVPNANPRAVDLDDEGRWWVLLGAPQRLAVYDPRVDVWTDHPIGMYPHSIALDPSGRLWFNGHFSVAPELIASLDPTSGAVDRFEVPPSSDRASGESTIPYGLRIDADGVIWATQLRGNHLIRLDPTSGDVRLFELPTSQSGPRRPDVGPDGIVWIPEFGANRLARFDPSTETFTEFEFPVKDVAPYVVRVDQQRETVWIGTGHGDMVASFDPSTERFTLYRLPTRGALIRHIDVDDDTGDLWAAYGASPGPPAKILRIQVP